MRKIQVVGAAMAFAAGMAFAGDPLWFPGIQNGQVTFPWIFECKFGDNATFHEDNPDDPCFKEEGGWWFGMVYGLESSMSENTYGCGTSTARRSGLNKVRLLNYEGGAVSFVGPDYSSCEGPDVADRETGDPKFIGDYLEFELTIGPGDYDNYDPDAAAFAVNLSTPPDPHHPVFKPRDLEQYKGFCLTYTSDHEAGSSANGSNGHDVAVELDNTVGEPPPHGSELYDSWLHYLEPASTPTTVNISWEGPQVDAPRYTPNTKGDWTQDNWAENPTKADEYIKNMTAVRVRLKGYEAKTVNFKLYKFGFLGDCGAATPVIASKNVPSVNFALNGRVLSAQVNKPALVQVYNLQGAIVQSKTFSPADSRMNLSNLPSGIYMVRAASLGYTSRIVVK